MSDFDKEAERERLREKYERDKQKRETTEKMSELLLQGATMTNAHCSDCNDPIFRYDGQEFCATCEKPVDRDTGERSEGDAAGEEGDEQANGQGAGTIEVTSPSDDARVSFGESSADDTGESATASGDEAEGQADETAGARGPRVQADQGRPAHSQPRAGSGDDAGRQRSEGRQPQPREEPPQQPSPAGGTDADVNRAGGADANVGAVRESLVRTLRRFSEQAEACEDPQRAREYLAAAREAAETLDALRR